MRLFRDTKPEVGMRVKLFKLTDSTFGIPNGSVWIIDNCDEYGIRISRTESTDTTSSHQSVYMRTSDFKSRFSAVVLPNGCYNDESNSSGSKLNGYTKNNTDKKGQFNYKLSDTPNVHILDKKNKFDGPTVYVPRFNRRNNEIEQETEFIYDGNGQYVEIVDPMNPGKSMVCPVFSDKNPHIVPYNYRGTVRDELSDRWRGVILGNGVYPFMYKSDIYNLSINTKTHEMRVSVRCDDKAFIATSRPREEEGDEFNIVTGIKICLAKIAVARSLTYSKYAVELVRDLKCILPDGVDCDSDAAHYLKDYLMRNGKFVADNAVSMASDKVFGDD